VIAALCTIGRQGHRLCFTARAGATLPAGRRWLCTQSAVSATEQAAPVDSPDRNPRGVGARTAWHRRAGQLLVTVAWIPACRAPGLADDEIRAGVSTKSRVPNTLGC
jgi:hypothetical protein